MIEKLVKRTIWVAKCECGNWQDVKTENPPREKMCPECGKWVEYVEESFTGPDTFDKK